MTPSGLATRRRLHGAPWLKHTSSTDPERTHDQAVQLDVWEIATVREIVNTIAKPKRHKFWVDAYGLVGRIRDVSLSWRSVKRIYGQHRRSRS